MKRTVLLLGCLLSMGLYAQTSPNGVYSTTEPRPTVLEKPASREIMGGTVIRVNFDETNAISATQKGAFEYACRIWEENIPTTFPINITVKFGTLQNPQCLAYVEPTVGLLESDAYSSQCFSNVYFKRKSPMMIKCLIMQLVRWSNFAMLRMLPSRFPQGSLLTIPLIVRLYLSINMTL